MESLLKKHKVTLSTPLEKFSEEAIKLVLYGSDEPVPVPSKKYPGTAWETKFDGIINFLKKQQETGSDKIQDWLKDFMMISNPSIKLRLRDLQSAVTRQ